MTSYGSVGRRVLRRTLTQRERCDAGGYTVPHHIKFGGGRSVPPWESLVAERAWGDISNDGNVAHTAGRKIQERENG